MGTTFFQLLFYPLSLYGNFSRMQDLYQDLTGPSCSRRNKNLARKNGEGRTLPVFPSRATGLKLAIVRCVLACRRVPIASPKRYQKKRGTPCYGWRRFLHFSEYGAAPRRSGAGGYRRNQGAVFNTAPWFCSYLPWTYSQFWKYFFITSWAARSAASTISR